ncbi:MAG: hypothetical protein L6Q31_00690 [Fimbriimonadaceae bacterium]|nr:hypothetical protein [Fimbriimonadaceae bacterium]NUM38286.1 hypothetical protein [Armatimonadota bacterium]
MATGVMAGGGAWCSIGARIAKSDPYAAAYAEVLDHAGIPWTSLDTFAAGALKPHDVLLLCGRGSLSDPDRQALESWLKEGGLLLVSGSSWGMAELLGLGECLRRPRFEFESQDSSRRIAFGGEPAIAKSAKVLSQTSDGLAVQSMHALGKGVSAYFAPHVGQTAALMQMGRGVDTDALGPMDGSAILDDGRLRAEDGVFLDFETDRAGELFAEPWADRLKESWIEQIVQLATLSRKPLALLWHWPNGARAGASVSIDCETFDVDQVSNIQRLLRMFGCPVTWLVAQPGFPLDTYRLFRSWDHEVGLLFTLDDDSGWTEERLKSQHLSLERAASVPQLISARAVDGRWKGYFDFYEMAEHVGIRVSASKGGRQRGVSGFLFGTGHPFFPTKLDGTRSKVLECPYSVYLPGEVFPEERFGALVEAILNSHGHLHIAFKSDALSQHHAVDALRNLLSLCHQQRAAFLKLSDVYAFERARRTLKMYFGGNEESRSLRLASDTDVRGLGVLLLSPGGQVELNGKAVRSLPFPAYGAQWTHVPLDLESKRLVELRLSVERDSRAA